MTSEPERIFLLNPSENQSQNRLVDLSGTAPVNLENVKDFSNVCRICATVTEFIVPLFSAEGVQNNLADKIHKHLPIQVSEQDLLPRVVCYQCASTLLAWHELVQCCVNADAALRTRLPLLPRDAEDDNMTIVDAGQNTDDTEQQNKFPEVADFVAEAEAEAEAPPPPYASPRAASPPPSASPSPSPSPPPSPSPARACAYCDAWCARGAYEQHLVATHAQMLFCCEECDSYIDRKDFLRHMSMHAMQYASGNSGAATRSSRKDQKKSDENENTEERPQRAPPAAGGENEFSDHSDTDHEFAPLPESVFEAIEDSQDARPPAAAAAPPAAGRGGRPKRSRSCPQCGKVFTASSSYFYHVKHSHGDSKEHECDVCGKKFATRANLVQHGPLHTGECRFECQRCGKRFKSKASRYIHAQTHTGVKKYSCPQCSKKFRWRTHLHRHMKRHAAEKSHVCAQCGRGFSVKCDLLRHARTHTAGNFECETCGHKFAQLRYLNVHMEKKHSASVSRVLRHRRVQD